MANLNPDTSGLVHNGRKPIGRTVQIAMPNELDDAIKSYAINSGCNYPEAVRRLLRLALII